MPSGKVQSMEIQLNDYVSPTDAAAMLGVSRQLVNQWMHSGRFTLVEVAGRIALFRSEVEKLAAKRNATSVS